LQRLEVNPDFTQSSEEGFQEPTHTIWHSLSR